jgi:hypothetical protein
MSDGRQTLDIGKLNAGLTAFRSQIHQAIEGSVPVIEYRVRIGICAGEIENCATGLHKAGKMLSAFGIGSDTKATLRKPGSAVELSVISFPLRITSAGATAPNVGCQSQSTILVFFVKSTGSPVAIDAADDC